MPLIAFALVAVTLIALVDPRLRRAARQHPTHAILVALLFALVVLVSFRSGRHWLALIASAAVVWGPRLLPWLATLRRLSRSVGKPPAGAQRPGRMSREEALAILGLEEGASREEITLKYRELIRRVHPDQGGSEDLARRINAAKATLLD
jgi:DnaJ homolog subfamily C member 19